MRVVGMATALSFSHKPDPRLDLCRRTLPSTCSARTLGLCYRGVFSATTLHGRVPLCITLPSSMPNVFFFLLLLLSFGNMFKDVRRRELRHYYREATPARSCSVAAARKSSL